MVINMKFMRENLTNEYGILELQDKILEIAVFIDNLCHKNNIQYCLMGGSALGAIRHKGFIPWDDDLDIFMRPNEYKRFKQAFEASGDKNPFYLQELSERNGKIASAKIRLNNTTYIENATKDWKIHHGIFVDIFILHNTLGNRFISRLQYASAKLLLAKGQSLKDVHYCGIKRLIISLIKILPFNIIASHVYKELYKYDEKDASFCCHFFGKAPYKKGLYLLSYFEKTIRVEFEKVYLDIPCNTEQYLTERFGDYMKLPNKENISLSQHAYKWDINNDFSLYVNENRDFSDEKFLI